MKRSLTKNDNLPHEKYFDSLSNSTDSNSEQEYNDYKGVKEILKNLKANSKKEKEKEGQTNDKIAYETDKNTINTPLLMLKTVKNLTNSLIHKRSIKKIYPKQKNHVNNWDINNPNSFVAWAEYGKSIKKNLNVSREQEKLSQILKNHSLGRRINSTDQFTPRGEDNSATLRETLDDKTKNYYMIAKLDTSSSVRSIKNRFPDLKKVEVSGLRSSVTSNYLTPKRSLSKLHCLDDKSGIITTPQAENDIIISLFNALKHRIHENKPSPRTTKSISLKNLDDENQSPLLAFAKGEKILLAKLNQTLLEWKELIQSNHIAFIYICKQPSVPNAKVRVLRMINTEFYENQGLAFFSRKQSLKTLIFALEIIDFTLSLYTCGRKWYNSAHVYFLEEVESSSCLSIVKMNGNFEIEEAFTVSFNWKNGQEFLKKCYTSQNNDKNILKIILVIPDFYPKNKYESLQVFIDDEQQSRGTIGRKLIAWRFLYINNKAKKSEKIDLNVNSQIYFSQSKCS